MQSVDLSPGAILQNKWDVFCHEMEEPIPSGNSFLFISKKELGTGTIFRTLLNEKVVTFFVKENQFQNFFKILKSGEVI